MRRVLVLTAVVACILLHILGQALGSEAPADPIAPPDMELTAGGDDVQSDLVTDGYSSQSGSSLSGQADEAIKTVCELEITENATHVDVILRSNQPNRASVRLDSPEPERVQLVISLENSLLGFDPAGVSLEGELISGLSAHTRDYGASEIALDVERFNGYSVLKGSEGEVIIRLPKTEQSILYGKTIVIDPGHGSFPAEHPHGDPGADRRLDGEVVWEKDLNLAVALKLRDMLLEVGANPILTRDSDVGLSLADRCRVADEEDADVFISIHHNSSRVRWSQISGVEIYHKSGDGLSKALAESLGLAMPQATGQRLAYVGVHRSFLLGVLETSRVPSVLVEVGFMNCLDELRRLVTEDFQIKAATGMIDGLVSYFSGESPGQLETAGSELSARSVARAPSGTDFLTELTSNLPEIECSEVKLSGGNPD